MDLSGYETDDILSQALDIFEENKADEILSQALDIFEGNEKCPKYDEGDKIFITQNTFKEQKDDVDESIPGAIDILEMCEDGGPYIIESTRPKSESGMSTSDRFKKISSEDINIKQKKFVPGNTAKSNSWAMNLFFKWTDFMLNQSTDNDCSDVKQILLEKDLNAMSDDEICKVLSVFIISVKKENGDEYKNETIYSIACAIQRYLQLNGRKVNFFTGDKFEQLRNVIDNVMIEKCKLGVSNVKKSADSISVKQEEFLWLNGFLGTDTPRKLLNTLFWVLGVNFGLRGGDEHRNLTFENFTISADSENRTFLCYTETTSKTYKGGLQHKHIEPHTARAYENKDKPERCPVKIYRTYMEKLPHTVKQNAFYLRPVAKPSENKPWFTCQPVGHNTLKSIVRDLMSEAGFAGYHTNHSLRVTTATRLFNSEAPEQVIREQTGHRSNAIFAYKRTSDDQKAGVSKMLQNVENLSPVKRKCQMQPSATETFAPVSELQPVNIFNCSNVTVIYEKNGNGVQ